MLAMELVRDAAARAPAPELAEAIMYESLSRGLNFKVSDGNVLTLTPPLTITEPQIDAAIAILDQSIAAASGKTRRS